MTEPWSAATVRTATSRWPRVDFDAAAFEAFVSGRAIDQANMSIERGEELALAHACLEHRFGALEALEAACGATMREAIARAGVADPDEVLQLVRLRLFTASPLRPAKIGEFRGEGALAAWLRTVALRVALSTHTPDDPADDEAQLRRLVLDLPSPEAVAIRAEAREALKAAMRAAIGQLDARAKTIVKLAGVDGLSLEQIGVVYGVHKATVSRWLSAIRTQLKRSADEHLHGQLGLTPSELRSLTGEVGSQLELSISKVLDSELEGTS
jgi:RNA polymerase sigma-70 factor (ECF subfamily)